MIFLFVEENKMNKQLKFTEMSAKINSRGPGGGTKTDLHN